MKTVAQAACVLALMALALAGCGARHDGGDTVTHQFGTDYFGVGGSLNLTDSVAGDAILAGGQVTTASEVKGDLVAAGGEVSLGGGVGMTCMRPVAKCRSTPSWPATPGSREVM